MTDIKTTRLSKFAREFNVGISTIVDFLKTKGINIESDPNAKITPDVYSILVKEYSSDSNLKKESEKLNLEKFKPEKKTISIKDLENNADGENEDDEEDEKPLNIRHTKHEEVSLIPQKKDLKIIEKIDLENKKKSSTKEKALPEQEMKDNTEPKEEVIEEKQPENEIKEDTQEKTKDSSLKVVGKINLDTLNQKTRPDKKSKKQVLPDNSKKEPVQEIEKPIEEISEKLQLTKDKPEIEIKEEVEEKNIHINVEFEKLNSPTIVGKIELSDKDFRRVPKFGKAVDIDDKNKKNKKRKRIQKDNPKVDIVTETEKVKTTPPAVKTPSTDASKAVDKKKKKNKRVFRPDVNVEEVDKQLKDTLSKMSHKQKSKSVKYRREKREAVRQNQLEEQEKIEMEKSILKVTEFVTVNELATMMNVAVTEIISTCMNLGLFVSINQRLDSETISFVADEFGFKVEFTSAEILDAIEEEEDKEEDLLPRPPVVTVMGHVDHGKTKLLDHIRSSNVIAGEAGGITQHIGAYNVKLEKGNEICFLDTPGHEAFTAMRARGAKVTDIAIIVVAADDGVKPQTVEAINHAQAAGVPIVFAINKIDKPDANPERVKEELANMNILVEDWGGKYQSQEISAKNGLNIDVLLEKVLLEAELLDLKANPKRMATGTVIESSLDKGRGYVATILVQNGTMRIGDILLAGSHTGRIKAMFNERNIKINEAGPSNPVLILGLDGAPQAGDKFNVMQHERDAKEIANKRTQLQREQGIRTKKHTSLEDLGIRIAKGTKLIELNVIVKGDVDGSVEALSDSLIKLSTEDIKLNVIHKAVGQISESDILLAAASDAIIIGFQVRPSLNAKRLAEKEEIDIRLYSIIYDAIDEMKLALEGMLSPEIKEEITSNIEITETFKITKVGTIAGCIVRDGKINRDDKIRIIRDGIVVYTGELASLKRFKDDAKEVVSGLECGLNIKNFNDIKVGDIVEGFKQFEIKKTL